MTRYLKAIGMSLAVVLALCAVAASTASAHTPAKFTYGAGISKVTAKQVGMNTFKSDLGAAKCNTVSATSTSLTEEEMSLAPTLSECVAFGLKAAWDVNGCIYRFRPSGTVDLVCGGEGIQITTMLCEVTVEPNQNNLEDVAFANGMANGKKDITVKLTLAGVKYTEHGAFCAHDGVTTNNGELTGEVTVTGEDAANNPVDTSWDPTVP